MVADMSRHAPRSLAAPFVVTLAALPACGQEPAKSPGAVVVPVESGEAGAAPIVTEPAADAGAPSKGGGRPTHRASWDVKRTADGKGCVANAQVDCPPGAACNPPRPTSIACPPGMEASATISRGEGETECTFHAFYDVRCPMGATCNPPPPRTGKIDCPE